MVNDELFWGLDRLHFVAGALGFPASPPRKQISLLPHRKNTEIHVKFYFDFSSPWSFLGSTQIERAIAETGANVKLEFVPILLGALFRKIGAPNLPSAAVSQAKLEYSRKDFADWVKRYGIEFVFTPHFPIRTIVPLRVVLASKKLCPDKTVQLIHQLYRAAWVEEQNIADVDVLSDLLRAWDFPASQMLKLTQTKEIKDALIANTTEAETIGCCGVPSFTVDNSPVIWGQDRLHIVQDLICGWKHPLQPQSNL